MRREVLHIWSPALDADGTVVSYGDLGRPVVVFPAERGSAFDVEEHGMAGPLAELVGAGRARLLCLDSFDPQPWSDGSVPSEERVRRHQAYESWVVDQVVPWVLEECGARPRMIATGGGLGAFHALGFALRRADVFPMAICLSGTYDEPGWRGWDEQGGPTTLADYVPSLHGERLKWLREQLSVLLVAGGAAEGRSEASETGVRQARRMAELLHAKGIRHELDVETAEQGDGWPRWQRQLARHLPRFC